jgi:hypothetical protein
MVSSPAMTSFPLSSPFLITLTCTTFCRTFSGVGEFPPSAFRGFTHHSSYAGDLIFGALGPGSGIGVNPRHGYYGSGSNTGGASAFSYGLGLSGMGGSGSEGDIHSMQLALPGIDDIEIAGIMLEDQHQQGSRQRSDVDIKY